LRNGEGRCDTGYAKRTQRQFDHFVPLPSIKALSTGTLCRRNGHIKPLNVVGPRIRRLRNAKNWSQNILAAKLQVAGLDKSRPAVARIESQIVHVCEYELLYFAKVLGVGLLDLYPEIDPSKSVHEAVTELMKPRKSMATVRRSRKRKGHKKSTGR